MSIILDGKVFRTLSDDFFVNGEKVVEAYIDGTKVYPDTMFGNLAVFKTNIERRLHSTSWNELTLAKGYNFYWIEDVTSSLSTVVEIEYNKNLIGIFGNGLSKATSFSMSNNEIAAKVKCKLTHKLIGANLVNADEWHHYSNVYYNSHSVLKDSDYIYDALNFTIDFDYYIITNNSNIGLFYMNDDYRKFKPNLYMIYIDITPDKKEFNIESEPTPTKKKTVKIICQIDWLDIHPPRFRIYYPFEYERDNGSEFSYIEELQSYTTTLNGVTRYYPSIGDLINEVYIRYDVEFYDI